MAGGNAGLVCSLIRSALFLLVYLTFGAFQLGVAYYAIRYFAPAVLVEPRNITGDYLAGLVGLFTLVSVVCYYGASYVVYGGTRRYNRY